MTCAACPLGSWWVRSTTDSRWNGSGSLRADADALVKLGQAHIDFCLKKFGKASADLEWRYGIAHCD